MNYDFLNKDTGEYENHSMLLCERDQFIKDHPELEQVILSPCFTGDPFKMGISKPPADFQKGIIDRIAAATPRNQLHNSRFRQNLGEV